MDDFNKENKKRYDFDGNLLENDNIVNEDIDVFTEESVKEKYEIKKRPSIKSVNVKEVNFGAKKKVNPLFAVFCICLCLLVAAASGYFSADYLIDKKLASADINEGSDNKSQNINITIDETANSTVEAVASKVSPSVVGIRTIAAVQGFFGGSTESTGEGSGIVYSEDGYIITNYHVINSAINSANSSIEVFFDEDLSESYSATVVGYNISHDLAVIKIEKKNLIAIEIADSSDLKVGQYCVAIGAPGGLEYMGSVTNGIISGLNRTLASSSYDTAIPLIQTDTAINPGNSGGALVNLQGQLIGVNSSKIVSESYEGMGFAIPSNTVVDICNKIIAKEFDPDPYVGITFSESWTPARLKKYNYPVGAVVYSVVEGGPAYNSNIRSGDIIVEFNGKEVESVEEFNDVLVNSNPGETAVICFYRSGRITTTSIKIGSNNSQ